MPDYTLLSSTMDILVPAERAPGIHVSDIITDYAIRLRLLLPDGSHAGDREGDEASPGQTEAMECGLALEWARARRLEADRPGGWLDLGTQYTDGIAWTPDAYDLLGWTDRAGVVHPPNCPWECKGTWMSVARGPGDPKLWRYEVQTGAYLYGCGRAFGTPHLTAVLDVTYFRGSYKDDQLVAHRRWRIDWEERPLLIFVEVEWPPCYTVGCIAGHLCLGARRALDGWYEQAETAARLIGYVPPDGQVEETPLFHERYWPGYLKLKLQGKRAGTLEYAEVVAAAIDAWIAGDGSFDASA